MLREGLGLVLPADCAGCGAWDTAVCADCRDLLSTVPVRSDMDAPVLGLPGDAGSLLPTWSLADYTGAARHVVLAWKRTGRADVARVVLDQARRGARVWAHDPDLVLDEWVRETGHVPGEWARDRDRDPGEWALDTGHVPEEAEVLVVPAPSGMRRRLRGMLVAADLADAVARGLAESGALRPGRLVRSADILRRTGGTDHARRGVRLSTRNRQPGVRVLANPAGAVVVLVDDVLTTGATLATCARRLSEAGARVAGALVVAATPPPGRASTH